MIQQMRTIALCLLLGLAGCATMSEQSASASQPPGLQVIGTHLADKQGKPIFLVGAARSSLDYSCQGDSHYTRLDYRAMRSWGMNTVRLPLSAPMWLNEKQICPTYRQTVKNAVANAEAEHLYVILALAYTSPFGTDPNPAGSQYPMANKAEALPLWQSMASQYATDPQILFELYSEPHDITNGVWRDGGIVNVVTPTTPPVVAGTYAAVGMQALVDLIHSIAPERITLVGGLDWASSFKTIVPDYLLHGENIVYSVHVYPNADNQDLGSWPANFGTLAQHAPVVATEFGQLDCGDNFIRPSMGYFQQHLDGMVAWTWNIGDCARPGIITDWEGTPTQYGKVIHDTFIQAHIAPSQ